MSEVFFINVFYDLRCYVRTRTDASGMTRKDNASSPELEAEYALSMSAGGGWSKIVIIDHFLLVWMKWG
ncbi:hypothetical protein [Nitrosospira multiformis]|uniref:hypothetical protein n=1 Tax=Nitrosospira multiformis TaxID=1231 RepID=UPI0011B21A0B|nr:hypothetical protein [Nitrosospira multiformis]